MAASLVDEVFQVLPIAGSELGSDFFDDSDSAGDDIRFTAADGTTELACHILFHDAGTETGRYFVDVSSVSNISSDVDIYVYYGNAGASPYAANATYGADAVWSDYAGVYFPGMSLLDYTDQASGRALTAVNTPGTAASGYEGITAAVYNGSSQYHTYAGTQSVTDWPLTLEAIANPDINTAAMAVANLGNTGNLNNFAILRYNGATAGDPINFSVRGNSATESSALTTSGFTASTTQYSAGNRDSDTGSSGAFLSGGNTGFNPTNVTGLSSFDVLGIGVLRRSSLTNYFDGNIAFVALSGSVRSDDFIATMHDAWSNASFISATAQETDTGGGGGTGGSFFFG